MKPSEKLYQINANISLKFIAMKQKPTLKDMEQLNCMLAQIIKEIRVMEERLNEVMFEKDATRQ